MKVYSLLGFVEYEGSRLVGVFGTLEGVIYCVESNDKGWYFDDMGYVVSELNEKIEDVLGVVEYVSFVRFNGRRVDV